MEIELRTLKGEEVVKLVGIMDMRVRKAYVGLIMETEEGEELGICMRDGGYELQYGGKLVRLVGGKVSEYVLYRDNGDSNVGNCTGHD